MSEAPTPSRASGWELERMCLTRSPCELRCANPTPVLAHAALDIEDLSFEQKNIGSKCSEGRTSAIFNGLVLLLLLSVALLVLLLALLIQLPRQDVLLLPRNKGKPSFKSDETSLLAIKQTNYELKVEL